MRRTILYLIVVALSAVSCKKDLFTSETISFGARDGEATRALMDDTTLKTAGNKLRVYDELTGFTGSASWMDPNENLYIADEIVYAGNPVWDIVSGRAYPWTSNGTHKFFSWLSYDQSLSMTEAQFWGASFNFNRSTKVLTLPQKVMDTATDQFDFMYSDPVSIAAASHSSNAPVELQLHHLFSALNMSVYNISGNTVLLKSVTLKGMMNKRSATVDYSSTTVSVTTSNLDSTDVVLFTSDDSSVDGYGTEYIDEDLQKQLTNFILMWPQTFNELEDARLEVKYKIKDSEDELTDELTAVMMLNNLDVFKRNTSGMDAGVKYSFLLEFRPSSIVIVLSALPWEYEAYDWDYSDHSISARSGTFKDGVLAFYRKNPSTGEYTVEPTTDEWSAKTMRISQTETLSGKFYIEAPTQGRWQVTAYPLSAAQYFEIEPASGEIDVFSPNDGKVEFTVRANLDLTPTSAQTLYFSVAIYFNGEWHDANSEFNRKNIKLILDAS